MIRACGMHCHALAPPRYPSLTRWAELERNFATVQGPGRPSQLEL